MKTKDNIHKVVNLNNFIKELRIYYEIITYSEYQGWNGSTFDCSTIRELKNILQYSILNIEQKV